MKVEKVGKSLFQNCTGYISVQFFIVDFNGLYSTQILKKKWIIKDSSN